MEAGKQFTAEGFTSRILRWYGAYFISFVGLIHLLLSGEHFSHATYLGILFLATFGVATVAALAILWTDRRWAWLLGATIAGGAFIVLLASRVFGLPGFPEADGQWFNFGGWMAVGFEIAFLAAVPLALTRRGENLVEAEQNRIDREKVPPARQETPEHFGLLEDEMREIRGRMASDVSDLRVHLEPRTVEKRARKNSRAWVQGFLRRLRGGDGSR